MTTAAETIVRKIALDNPASVRVFESLGIDYCCGGNLPLKDACLRANVSPDTVLKLLEDLDAARQGTPDEWIDVPFAELTGHIVSRHHGYVRSEGPRLLALTGKVTSKHGAGHPELAEIGAIFAAVFQKLSIHMLKEEQVLFPFLNSMDAAHRSGQPLPAAFFGSVRNPIASMLTDHNDAGESVAGISTLSGGYRTPPDACPSYTALYSGLAEFERDLHRHVHLENNILFPRALEMEQS
jgi:regulator of cell morphogenesis and NO signaling